MLEVVLCSLGKIKRLRETLWKHFYHETCAASVNNASGSGPIVQTSTDCLPSVAALDAGVALTLSLVSVMIFHRFFPGFSFSFFFFGMTSRLRAQLIGCVEYRLV